MEIETERLTLREFRPDDWVAILDYASDPLYQRYYAEGTYAEPVIHERVARLVALQAAEPRHVWQLVITERGDGRLIGNVGIRVNDAERREANIGLELRPDRWRRGYASEAARAIVAFGFAELDLHRVWAECVADNTGSWRVMEKLGMRREAHFREHQWYRGRWWDTLIYAILSDEWKG